MRRQKTTLSRLQLSLSSLRSLAGHIKVRETSAAKVTNKFLAPTNLEKVYGLRVSWCHDGQRFAVSQSSGVISLFEMEPSNVPRLLDNLVAGDETRWVWDLSFDSTGNFLVSGNSGGIVKLWKQVALKLNTQKLMTVQNDSPTVEGPMWKCLKHREIKLHDFMDGRNTGITPPSPTISSLVYRELPLSIYEELKHQDKIRQVPYLK